MWHSHTFISGLRLCGLMKCDSAKQYKIFISEISKKKKKNPNAKQNMYIISISTY